MAQQRMTFRATPLFIVLLVVMANITGAVVLKELAMRPELSILWLISGVAIVVFLNGFRFVIWGIAHSRYPLSMTFPLTSLFFPLLLAVSYFYGDPLPWTKWLGTGLITAGVFWLAWKNNK